jgi:hypothetical protein
VEEICNSSSAILKEYYELLAVVAQFDQRLFLVKGWGVTFSLATLALALQRWTWSLFLVAALSAVSFWSLEAVIKGHQMQYYPRMREVEIVCADDESNQIATSPRIDWSWEGSGDTRAQIPTPRGDAPNFVQCLFFGAVALPHVITFLAGILFAWISWRWTLEDISKRSG